MFRSKVKTDGNGHIGTGHVDIQNTVVLIEIRFENPVDALIGIPEKETRTRMPVSAGNIQQNKSGGNHPKKAPRLRPFQIRSDIARGAFQKIGQVGIFSTPPALRVYEGPAFCPQARLSVYFVKTTSLLLAPRPGSATTDVRFTRYGFHS